MSGEAEKLGKFRTGSEPKREREEWNGIKAYGKHGMKMRNTIGKSKPIASKINELEDRGAWPRQKK